MTANITAKAITGSFTASNKQYDGTTSASISSRSLSDAINGDNVSLGGGTASFDNKNVGTGKTVTGTGFSLSGADADNYSLASNSLTTTADITAASVTGSFTAADKPYDGNTTATILNRSLRGVIGSDDVTLTGGSATFNSAAVGTSKTVTGTSFSLSGADAGNYSLGSVSTTTASITAWALKGFYSPVGETDSIRLAPGGTLPTSGVWQPIRGGNTVPLKFNVYSATGGSELTNTSITVQSFQAFKINCVSGATDAEIPSTELSTGSTILRYADGQFIQNWATPKVTGADICYRATVNIQDGSSISAFFRVGK